MKPAWDKLMDAFKDSTSTVVAKVDCTGAGKKICNKQNVDGFPTIKYGNPEKLQEYDEFAPRDFETLKKFADENLGPSCSPWFIDLCDADKRKTIEQLQAMSSSELDAAIGEKLAEIEKPKAALLEYGKIFSKNYQESWKRNKKDVEAIENSLRLMKKVEKRIISVSNSEEL